jgi:pyruvate ferredoxin oxidoreductase gamma subunit
MTELRIALSDDHAVVRATCTDDGCGEPARSARRTTDAPPRAPGEAAAMAMFRVRIHGRGGQGVVTAAELLSAAAFLDGRHAQAFPSFGSERTGAPVMAFCRVGDRPIRSHEPVTAPDAVVIQDPTLLHQVDVFGGLRADGLVLVNTSRTVAELGLAELRERFPGVRLHTVPASELAREHLGRPMPGAPLLGAFTGLTGFPSIGSLAAAIQERFPGPTGERNAAAAEAARALVVRESAHA